MREFALGIQQAQQRVNQESRRLQEYLKLVLSSTYMVDLRDEDGFVLFGNYGMDNIMLSEYLGDSHDGIQIEGFRPDGGPVLSEVMEGMTNSWDDMPADIFASCALALQKLLESQLIFGGPQIIITPEEENIIVTKIGERYSEGEYGTPGRLSDNSNTNKFHGGMMEIPGLPAGHSVYVRTFSPTRFGDKQSVMWSLCYLDKSRD